MSNVRIDSGKNIVEEESITGRKKSTGESDTGFLTTLEEEEEEGKKGEARKKRNKTKTTTQCYANGFARRPQRNCALLSVSLSLSLCL